MKKLLGLRCLAAVAMVTAAVGSIAGGFAGTAGATGTAPPWEVTGTNYGSVGGLNLYNASGQQVTGGNLTDAPIAAYVEGTSTIRAGDTKATLYAYTPVSGVAPGNWSGQALSASTTYPNASAPSPLNSATLPVQTGGSLDESLSEFIAQFPNNDTTSDGYAGIYQLRLKSTASGLGGNTTYDSADIQVSGSTWSLVYPTQPTTTALSTTPASRAAFGASVGLTATITPSNATGTVQFKNGTATIGSPVTVSGGTASTTTSSLPVGNDELYAVFTPSATSAGTGDSASSGNTLFDVQIATATMLTTSPVTQATLGASVQLNAAVSVTPSTASPAPGTVQFENGTTDIGTPVTVSSGVASTTTASLPTGNLTLNAVFTASGNYASSSGSTSFTVNPPSVAPSITSGASASFTVGTAGSFTVTASGSPAPTFSETGGLPSGVTLNPTTGVLSGTPGAGTAGSYSITLTAANGVLPNASQSFSLTVAGSANTTITCGVSGTVTFASPGLSFGGALTANTSVKTAASITPTGSGCSGTAISISIPSATTACPQTGGVPTPSDPSACLASKVSKGVTTYAIGTKPNYYDTGAQYAATGVSSIGAALSAKPLKTTVDNIALVLDYGTASQITGGSSCAGDDGFYLTGNAQVKGLTVATYTATACLVDDTGTNTTHDFASDITAGNTTIATAIIGGLSNMTITFPNAVCGVTGATTYASPGLSFGGALSSNTTVKNTASITPTGAGCSGLPIAVSIPSATTACPETGGVPTPSDPSACLAFKVSKGVTTYSIASKPNYYDTGAQYTANGVSNLAAALTAKPLKATIDNVALVLTYGAASKVNPGGACGSNAGFYLTGSAQVKGLDVATYTATVCLSGDAGTNTTGNFITDLTSSASIITSATVGGPSNLTVTFG